MKMKNFQKYKVLTRNFTKLQNQIQVLVMIALLVWLNSVASRFLLGLYGGFHVLNVSKLNIFGFFFQTRRKVKDLKLKSF